MTNVGKKNIVEPAVSDSVVLSIIFVKMLGMILLISGGIYALSRGFRLIQDGAGTGREVLLIKFGRLEADARSVGSVVMGTGLGWAFLGFLVSPNLEMSDGFLRITSFELPGLELEAPTIVTDWSRDQLRGWDEQELELQFREFFEANHDSFQVTVNGEQSQIESFDLDEEFPQITLQTEPIAHHPFGQSPPGIFPPGVFPSASVTYYPIVEDDRVVFRPSGAAWVVESWQPDGTTLPEE